MATRPALGHPPVHPSGFSCSSLAVVIVRPTRYDEDGYVVRHWRGTLPSNTLSCLNGLTEDAVASGALGSLSVTVHTFDEAVDRIDPRRIVGRRRRPGTRVLVALAGVQTNQFPRACDLARAFLAQGVQVMIGGFHVSGSAAMAHGLTPECRQMIDAGATIVLGEVEDHWAELLRDSAAGCLKPLYDFLQDLPDLGAKPLPKVSLRLQKKFAVRGYGTIDAGRGCPFACSFCTIINVQGRTMRSRSAAHVIEHIRSHYRIDGRPGINHYFFTDDNFSRNPAWEAIFDGLIRLREREGLAIDFMMQVDTQAPRIPRFVEKAARAGCVQVFIGMESLRDDNLKAAGKRQNKVQGYRDLIAAWHEAGVLCHVGFIIGFPHDTYDRVMEDVRTLRDDLLVDQASFFVLTPLPGSRDHQDAVGGGVPLDPDYNNFDSFRVTMPHPLMSDAEWMAAYRDAWTSFYTFDHMRRALLRQNPHTYWGMLKCFLWYRASMVEGAHPMVTGFVRLKDRRSRRPGFPVEGRLRFLRRRASDLTHLAIGYARLVLEMQELWLLTRIRREDYAFAGDVGALRTRRTTTLDIKTRWSRLHAALAARLDELCASAGGSAQAAGAAMTERLAALRQALGTRAEEIMAAAGTARDLRLPGLPPLRRRRLGPRLAARLSLLRPPSLESRQALTAYWHRTSADLRSWRFWRINPIRFAWNSALDARNTLAFFVVMTLERY